MFCCALKIEDYCVEVSPDVAASFELVPDCNKNPKNAELGRVFVQCKSSQEYEVVKKEYSKLKNHSA